MNALPQTSSAAESLSFGPRLNAEQLRAATHGCIAAEGFQAGPQLIIAGAGTGKTNTLAHRVAYLLLQRVAPERILLLTFTRRAAQEMLRRAELIAAETLRNTTQAAPFHANATRLLWSGTFHSIANRLLREYTVVLGIDPAFSVIDRGDAADLMDAAAGARLVAQGKAVSTQRHLPRHLLASGQHSPLAAKTGPKIGRGCLENMSKPSRRSIFSITTTCCCTGIC